MSGDWNLSGTFLVLLTFFSPLTLKYRKKRRDKLVKRKPASLSIFLFLPSVGKHRYCNKCLVHLSGQISKTVPPKEKQAKTQVIYLDVFQLKTSLKPHDANFKEQNLNKKPNLRSYHDKGWKSFHAMHWIIPGFRRISGSSFIYISKIYHNSVSQFWSCKVLMQSFQFFAISRWW